MDAKYRCPSTTVMTSGNETILPDFRPTTSNATTPSGEILFDAEFAIPRFRILAIQFGLFPLYNHCLRPQNICVRTVFTLLTADFCMLFLLVFTGISSLL